MSQTFLAPTPEERDAGAASDSLAAFEWTGQLQLLIIQPSPFCNLDCDYCYLPDRKDRRKMDFSTLEAISQKVFRSALPSPSLSVVWHAGEPLVVPRGWYANAFASLARYCPTSVKMTQHFQTNGVLIDDQWCRFIEDHDVRVGVSIDGPEWLHNKHRRTRSGCATFTRVMQGIDALRKAEIPFHVICVLTREALDHPDEIFDFFDQLGTVQLCFNVEETEASNRSSSLSDNPADSEAAFRAFFARIVDRLRLARSSGLTSGISGMRIREVDDVLYALRHPEFGRQEGNSQNTPGQILSVAWDGTFCTGSPELLGQHAPVFGNLALGNVLVDPLPPAAEDARYIEPWKAIRAGVKACRSTCAYFDFCRGGAPANKLGERGRFDVTETLYCKLSQQTVTDVVLAALDRDLPKYKRLKRLPTWFARFSR